MAKAKAKDERPKTLKYKIDELVENNEDKGELKKAILNFVQRTLYPDQFCPKCDERLFSDANGYTCLNCGHEDHSKPTPTPQRSARPAPRPRPAKSAGKKGEVPAQVEEVIQRAERSSVDTSKKGKQIRDLADKLDGSTVEPTPQDTARVKNLDPNIRDVNWV